MNVLIFQGCSDHDCAVILLANSILEGIHRTIPEAHVKSFSLNSPDLLGCQDCRACANFADIPGCAVKDSLTRLLDEMAQYDLFILVSPVYMMSLSSQSKTLLDRMFCLKKYKLSQDSLVQGRKFALALSLKDDDRCTQTIVSIVEKFCCYLQMDFQGSIIVEENADQTLSREEVLRARDFGSALVRH